MPKFPPNLLFLSQIVTDSSPCFLQTEFVMFLGLASTVHAQCGMCSHHQAGVLSPTAAAPCPRHRVSDGAESIHADACTTGVRASFPSPPPPFPNSNESHFLNIELGHYPGTARHALSSHKYGNSGGVSLCIRKVGYP